MSYLIKNILVAEPEAWKLFKKEIEKLLKENPEDLFYTPDDFRKYEDCYVAVWDYTNHLDIAERLKDVRKILEGNEEEGFGYKLFVIGENNYTEKYWNDRGWDYLDDITAEVDVPIRRKKVSGQPEDTGEAGHEAVCPSCSHVFPLRKTFVDELGLHTVCPKCEASFDVDEEVELGDSQIERNDEVYDAVFQMCKTLTNNPDLEWGMGFIGDIAEYAATTLAQHGRKVWFPYVVTEEDGSQHVEDYYEPEEEM